MQLQPTLNGNLLWLRPLVPSVIGKGCGRSHLACRVEKGLELKKDHETGRFLWFMAHGITASSKS